MVVNKNQHIIPQHYLRGFSTDRDDKSIKNAEKRICRYNIKEAVKPWAAIKKTCACSYFYVTDDGFDEVDEAIKLFEDIHAPILDELINKRELPLESDKTGVLYTFIMLMFTRTKCSRESAVKIEENELTERAQRMLENIGYQNHKAKVSVEPLKAQFDLMKFSLLNSFEIGDLGQVLLINESKRHFITSDNPVVLYNYKMINNACITGVKCSGLMILCPLTESLLLLFFDKELYDISTDTPPSVIVREESDVDSINKLQLMRCYEEIYCYEEPEIEYIKALHESVKDHITSREVLLTEYLNAHNREVRARNPKDIINYKIRLSFINLNKKSDKKYTKILRNHKRHYDPHPVTRRELSSYRR